MFSTRLKDLRMEKNLTQKQLAEILHMQNTAISKYELGERKPDQEILIKLAEYFHTTTDYLLGNSDIRNPYSNTIIKSDIKSEKEEQLPDDFETPEEAIDFLLNKNVIMGAGGFDVNELSDEEKVEFAHELLQHLKLLSLKYKKN